MGVEDVDVFGNVILRSESLADKAHHILTANSELAVALELPGELFDFFKKIFADAIVIVKCY